MALARIGEDARNAAIRAATAQWREVLVTAIVDITSDQLDSLRELWLALHRHHAAVGSQPLVSDESASWQRRRALYERWLRAGEAFVLVAEIDDEPAGYAVVHLHEGPDDT